MGAGGGEAEDEGAGEEMSRRGLKETLFKRGADEGGEVIGERRPSKIVSSSSQRGGGSGPNSSEFDQRPDFFLALKIMSAGSPLRLKRRCIL